MASRERTDSLSPLPHPNLPLPGSCSIRLWAAPGLHLVFRLKLGEGSHAVARRFEHTFQPDTNLDTNSHASFQILNFCQLNQVWAHETDMVVLNFELLEF